MTANLSWGHWTKLLAIKDINKKAYYVKQSEELLLHKDYECIRNMTNAIENFKINILFLIIVNIIH